MGSQPGADLRIARAETRVRLVRSVFGLVGATALALMVRELVAGGPVLPAILGTLLATGALAASYRKRVPIPALAMGFFGALVALITLAALDLGGATGSALSLAFIPGFLAILVLGPAWGWTVCAAMLASFAWLFFTTELSDASDVRRFGDEIAMTVFAAGLAHTLFRSFLAYEAAIEKRRAFLVTLAKQREEVTRTIYEELEPTAAKLSGALTDDMLNEPAPRSAAQHLKQLVDGLRRSKELAYADTLDSTLREAPDSEIRTQTMRAWLGLGAVLSTFFAARNWLSGVQFVPSLVTIALCALLANWLRRDAARKHLELTAFGIGLAATGPLLAYVYEHGTPDAPALVVTPGIVVFTALLSRGPAAWALLSICVCLLVWTAIGQSLDLRQSRLLGNLGLSFLVVVIALRSVFELRARYARALLQQGHALLEALRQRRRLAGTLFHDVSNHVQSILLELEVAENSDDVSRLRSLSLRVERLLASSRGLLLGSEPAPEDAEVVPLCSVSQALLEAFRPRLAAKDMRLEFQDGSALEVRATKDLLIESVFGNLVSNAIKFSPNGSTIALHASLQGAQVRITVSDRGPGIPSDVLDGLLLEGAVPSRHGTAGEQGQGYGLQLVSEHLRRMGGRLELRARVPTGTDAIVWLPSA